MMKSIILTIIMLMVLACGGSDSENNPMPTPIPTPTPTPTPEPEGYSDTVKNLFYELCLPAANDEFCECSVNQIEENIPVDEMIDEFREWLKSDFQIQTKKEEE